VVADDLGSQLLCCVGNGGALVGGQLRADYHRGVSVFLGDVHPYSTSAASRDRVDVVGRWVHLRMILAQARFPATGFTPPDCVQSTKGVVTECPAPCFS
jgi:hypothetical protein